MFAAEPDNALLLSELCERVYRRSRKRIEKKHRISVARAAKGISELDYMAREAVRAGSARWELRDSSPISCFNRRGLGIERRYQHVRL